MRNEREAYLDFVDFIELVKINPDTAKQLWLVGGEEKAKKAFLNKYTKELGVELRRAVRSKVKIIERMPTVTTKEETKNLWIIECR